MNFDRKKKTRTKMASNNNVFTKNDKHITNTKYLTNDILSIINSIFFLIKTVFDIAAKHFCSFLFFSLLLLIIYVLYKSYLSPVLYVKELSEVGFEHLPRKDRSLHIIQAQKIRKLGSKLPPPFPNGWFALAESRDLKIGSVIPVDALGLNLCVYRGEDGIVRIVDAYCPHLGANLAIGGTVCGNCIECPFHQWKFGADGNCVTIPGADLVPKGIAIKTYPSMEVDGAIWIWYHVDGLPPQWKVAESEESKNWGYRGRNEFTVNAHIQEIPENGADVAHLNAVHTVSLLTDMGHKYPILNHFIGRHTWEAQWSKDKEDHVAVIKIVHNYIIMKMNLFPTNVVVHQIGPAHVRLNFDSPLGPIMISQSVTPMGPLLQKVVHRVYAPWYSAVLGAAMVIMEAYQFQRDVIIWNNKKYISSPAYTKTDKTIRTYRAWFNQFYSENSISLKNALQNPLDW